MKVRTKLILGCLSVGGLLPIGVLLFRAEQGREIAAGRRRAERAVIATVDKIARLNTRDISVGAITNSAVPPASVQLLGSTPIVFRVEAHTTYPDWMIYEYDSRTPERGVQHYLF